MPTNYFTARGDHAKIRLLVLLAPIFLLLFAQSVAAQDKPSSPSGIALAPARVELEMKPGGETTLVINLDYHSAETSAKPSRIVASLNDWEIGENGQISFLKSGSLPNSAGDWLTYTPTETVVAPNTTQAIRVTVAVPADAAPGDHLTALIIEQHPDNLKFAANSKQISVRYRMAAVFYIKVPNLIKRGELENLQAVANAETITVTPTLKNEGNTVLRPSARLRIIDGDGQIIAEMNEIEPLPILGGKKLMQPITVAKKLASGAYTVKFLVEFGDGRPPTEGVCRLDAGIPGKPIPASQSADRRFLSEN